MTEAQKRAKKAYKAKIKRLFIELYPTDADILEHLQKQESTAGYIKQLIREDIQKGQ